MDEITAQDLDEMKKSLLEKYSNEEKLKDFRRLQFELRHPVLHRWFSKKSMMENYKLQKQEEKKALILTDIEERLILLIREIGGGEKVGKSKKTRDSK